MPAVRSKFLVLLRAGILASLLLPGCNQIPAGTAAGGSNFVCQGSGNSFASCCAGHGGALSCASGYYFRSSDGALACQDGSVSGTCYR